MRKRDALFAILLSLYTPSFSQGAEPAKAPFADNEEVQLLKTTLPERYHSLLERFYEDLKNKNITSKDERNKERIKREERILYHHLKFNFGRYLYLSKIGATKASMELLISRDVRSMVDGFRNHYWPREVLQMIGLRNDRIAYSKAAAEKDKDWGKGVEWAKSYLTEKLSSRAHAYRPDTDYFETPDQLKDFYNKHTVFLVKRFVDFIDSGRIAPHLESLFAGKKEQGGFVFDEDPFYKFVFMGNTNEGSQAVGHYSVPDMEHFLKHIGLLHTHNIVEAARYPGPSGIAKNHVLTEADNNEDLGVLRKAHCYNPYRIDIVITELEKKIYNFDLFFQDVHNEDCESAMRKNLKVLDIGIFDFN